MTANTSTVDPTTLGRIPATQESTDFSAWQAALLAQLLEWFGIEFHLLDGNTGNLLHCAFDQSARDWGVRGSVCRSVAARGKSVFIEEEDPLLVLGLPVPRPQGTTLVAVGTFVSNTSSSTGNETRIGEMLGLEPEDARDWIRRQTRWSPDALLRMGQLAIRQLGTERQVEDLEHEVRDLSFNLSTTYEEIGLLYRLTQNLKLSSNDEELGTLALEWLGEVLPVESMAIQLVPLSKSESHCRHFEPTLLTYGPCPVTCNELTQIIEHFNLKVGHRPLIVNQAMTQTDDWQWPDIREMIVVPLSEGDHCFGWLVAFNQATGGKLGTVEASMLSLVGAILGIHNSNIDLYHQQRELFAGVVGAIASAIDAKDPSTCGHSNRVARIAVCLAKELGCNRRQLETIYLAGLLHDVGKIGINDTVLRKPDKLTEAEYEHIKTHSKIGHRILSDIKQLEDILPVVLHHHEHWNGNGYPHGLAGEAIPLSARIVAVADSFDAMTSNRPYRQGLADEILDAILRDGAGKQWDASVVNAFFRIREEIRDISQKTSASDSYECPAARSLEFSHGLE